MSFITEPNITGLGLLAGPYIKGSAWTANNSSNTTGKRWESIAWDPINKTFACAGNSSDIGATTNQIQTSTDGISWTERTTTGSNHTLANIKWIGGSVKKLITIGSNAVSDNLKHSSDGGITWTNIDDSLLNVSTWTDLAYSEHNSRIIILSDTVNAVYSDDLSTWNNVVSSDIKGNAIIWANNPGRFVTVGDNNTIKTSNDGLDWTTQEGPVSTSTNQWSSITYSPQLGLYVSVAKAGSTTERLMYSYNSLVWYAGNTADDTVAWESVIWVSELANFISVGSTYSKRLQTSTDGINWTLRTAPNVSAKWKKIAWSPDLKIIVAGSGSLTANDMMYSKNPYSE